MLGWIQRGFISLKTISRPFLKGLSQSYMVYVLGACWIISQLLWVDKHWIALHSDWMTQYYPLLLDNHHLHSSRATTACFYYNFLGPKYFKELFTQKWTFCHYLHTLMSVPASHYNESELGLGLSSSKFTKKNTVKVIHMSHALYSQSSEDIQWLYERKRLEIHPSSLWAFMRLLERGSDLWIRLSLTSFHL